MHLSGILCSKALYVAKYLFNEVQLMTTFQMWLYIDLEYFPDDNSYSSGYPLNPFNILFLLFFFLSFLFSSYLKLRCIHKLNSFQTITHLMPKCCLPLCLFCQIILN